MLHKKQLLSLIVAVTYMVTTHCDQIQKDQAQPTYSAEYDKQVHISSIQAHGVKAEPKKEPVTLNVDNPWEMVKALFSGKTITLSNPSLYDQYLLTTQKTESYNSAALIDFTFMNALEVVAGKATHPEKHLTSYIIPELAQLSVPAQISVANTLAHPIADTKELTARATIITTIANDAQLRETTAKCFKKARKAVPSLLFFDQETDKFFADQSKKLYWSWPILKSMNNSVAGLEAGIRTANALLLLQVLWAPVLVACEKPVIKKLTLKGIDSEMARARQRGVMIADEQIEQTKQQVNAQVNALLSSKGAYAYNAFLLGLHTYSVSYALSCAKLNRDIANLMHQKLIDVATYLNAMKKLCILVKRNETLKHAWKNVAHLQALITPSHKHSEEFNELIALLSTDTFKGEASIFSITGRVLRAYTLMSTESVRKELNAAINAFAEFEVYCALANTMNDARNNNATYCAVEFVENSTAPYINAVDFWNPFVSSQKAVTNTVALGGNNVIRNIILTGPNTGGKSTFAKGLMLNELMAHTFGIAAARSFITTPFTNLNCYLNISDDTATGQSGFKAEVNRAKELVQTIKTTPGFAFVIIDEIFTGTTPDQAEKLAYMFMKQIDECANCIFLNPTHYQSLVKLGNESTTSKNCHMQVITDENGRVTNYTYKLVDGPSTVHNAQQVAQEGNAIW